MNLSAAYGLTFSSPFIIKEFIRVSEGEADVKISFGNVPKGLSNPSPIGFLWREEDGKLLLDIEDIARFLIAGDSEIVIELYPEGKEDDMRRFLLGSVLGVLLHLKKIVILRASAVETEKGAILFLGFSGAGKTGFLFSLLQGGGKMVSDEKTAVSLDSQGNIKVLPGYPEIALSKQIVNKFKIEIDESRVNREIGKYFYRTDSFASEPASIREIYWLQNHNGEELEVESITDNNAKFNLLNSFIYLNPYPFNPFEKINYFKIFTEIARATPLTRIKYSLKIDQYAEIEKRIAEDLAR